MYFKLFLIFCIFFFGKRERVFTGFFHPLLRDSVRITERNGNGKINKYKEAKKLKITFGCAYTFLGDPNGA